MTPSPLLGERLLLLGERTILNTRMRLDTLGLDLLPSNGDLTAAEVTLLHLDDRELVLERKLQFIEIQERSSRREGLGR